MIFLDFIVLVIIMAATAAIILFIRNCLAERKSRKENVRHRIADFFVTKNMGQLKKDLFLYGNDLSKDDIEKLEQFLADQVIEQDEALKFSNHK